MLSCKRDSICSSIEWHFLCLNWYQCYYSKITVIFLLIPHQYIIIGFLSHSSRGGDSGRHILIKYLVTIIWYHDTASNKIQLMNFQMITLFPYRQNNTLSTFTRVATKHSCYDFSEFRESAHRRTANSTLSWRTPFLHLLENIFALTEEL